ncbi:MAG: DUF3656 domain-containing protein [Peptostreptococcaceae bacterium]
MTNIELLSPVGSFDALKAAVQNGADSVYLGGKDFSARASANNFSREELVDAVKYAHIRGVEVFVTANTLIKENEVADFLEYAKFLYDIDIDAIILQDIGMARLLKEKLPDFELHASTQMVAHSLEDVKYLESVGFDRVVLAREVSVTEIKYICENSTADIEVFVHGALCVSYSGQCFMSSMLGNRSGNRGRCAQPCRQRYNLIDYKSKEVINTNGDYLLSQKDLNAIENINEVIDAGVYSLKIEGRMKKPEYVATVTESYRKTIDEYLKTKKVQVSDETMSDLYTMFNRKFTKGLLLGDVGIDTMNSELPNNIGLFVGTVIDYNKKAKRLKLKLDNTLKKGDGINLGGGTIGRILKGNEIYQIAHKGEIIELDFVGEAKKNQIVYKTSDGDLLDRVQKTFMTEKELRKNYVNAKVTIKLNEKAILELTDYNENTAMVSSENVVEKALKVALSEDKVETQIRKMGNTPYEVNEINLEIDSDVSMPISVLNQMRRECISLLDEKRIKVKNRNYKNSKVDYSPKIIREEKEIKLNAKVKNLEQLNSLISYDLDKIYYEDVFTLDEAIKIADKYNKKLIYSSPRIIRHKEYNNLKKAKNIDEIQVSNWGSIAYFSDKKLNIDYFLHSFNSQTLKHFEEINVNNVCISQELNLSEIKETIKYSNLDIESIVYGYSPLMLTEYCPMGVLVRDCKKDKRNSECRESIYALQNMDGEEFRVSQDLFCRSTIYNSKVTLIAKSLEELKVSKINNFRLDFTLENSEEVKEVVESFFEIIENDYEIGPKFEKLLKKVETTSGHYYKGVE